MKQQANKLIVICGPTATGKTALGVALARALDGEVVSADSMQVYRGMDIGTAKPTQAERCGVAHHMLDVAEPEQLYSAARYVEGATRCVDDIFSRGKQPIVVGGTGLYIDGLVAGRSYPAFSGAWREKLQARAAVEGTDALLRELATVDPARAARLHPSDTKRIVRALEVWHETGQTITAHDACDAARPPRYDAVYLGLSYQARPDLYAGIDARVDAMRAAGLEGEVATLLARGVSKDATAMQAIGYKELTRGHSPDAAFAEIKLRSRQYAKRQLSWFGRNPSIHWYLHGPAPNFAEALHFSTNIWNKLVYDKSTSR